MKKYIPYIAIPLLIYLVVGFIKMQFNPAYWEQTSRGVLIVLTVGLMLIYRISKLVE